ncbi:MAG: hypothetical protein ACOCVC_08495, partial [Spirochaeta sp.]
GAAAQGYKLIDITPPDMVVAVDRSVSEDDDEPTDVTDSVDAVEGGAEPAEGDAGVETDADVQSTADGLEDEPEADQE